MNSDELIPIPIYSALNKPTLFMGADRELALLLTLICGVMLIVSLSFLVAVTGVILWIIGITLLRMMAKADPIMRKVFVKQTKYKRRYNAHSGPFVREI
ncbi:MAG: VirB3 family type IV secretion system protein [Endomicrobium sp.]|jgi:type IV secretion system protein VirB3|nr:VirB3 family type IV secretion system protein [Endomicrobium sp.]